MSQHTRQLGRLSRLAARDYWASEAGDFTPWLAQPENIALLAEALGVELEVSQSEQRVGPFRADLVCTDTITHRRVLIENQLERTDHTHLGQLLTYAAGLDAVSIVWIADEFTEQHRAALDWLNRMTVEGVNFFGLEIELWRIGDSVPAPKFNVVVKPNEWVQAIADIAQQQESVSETRQLYLEYWDAFMNHLKQSRSMIRPKSPQAQMWADFPIGRAGFWVSAAAPANGNSRVQLIVSGSHRFSYFELLKAEAQAIEQEFGGQLEWEGQEHRKQLLIRRALESIDPNQRNDWPRQHHLIMSTVERFMTVFASRVRALPSGDELALEDVE